MKRSLKQNRLFPLVFTFVLLVAAIFIVRQSPLSQQPTDQTRTKATQASRLYFSPASSPSSPIQKQTGEAFSLDVMLDPGSNVVSFVKFQLVYDASKISVSGANALVVNSVAFSQTLEGPVSGSGTLAVAAGIGSDPTKGITTPTKVATVTFTASQNSGAPVEIKYGTISEVLSIGSDDRASDNVLSTTQSAFVLIGQQTATIIPSPTGQTNPTSANPTISGSNPSPTNIPMCSVSESNYFAQLTGNNVIPPNLSSAKAQLVLSKQTTPNYYTATMTWTDLPIKGVKTIHIHSPARPGETGPVSITIYNNPLLSDFVKPFVKNDLYIPENVYQDIISGKAYVDIHTTNYSNGELRGQLLCGAQPTFIPTPTIQPTLPAGPTPTMEPGGFRLILQLLFHGIGSAGDSANKNESTLSNKNPVHQEVPLNVQIVNSDNKVVATKLVTAFYDADNGVYFSHVDVPTTLPKDDYVVKVKADNYLRKLMPGFFTIEPGKSTTIPKTDLIAGDVNGDNQINVLDYNVLYDCGYGALKPLPIVDSRSQFHSQVCDSHQEKKGADVNDDGRISASDYNLFIRELSVQTGE
jgi:hypothetical protein